MNTLARIMGGVALAALAIAAACGSDSTTSSPTLSGSETPVPTPTLSPLVRTPGPVQPPPVTEYQLIYREQGVIEDIIWATALDDPNQRQELVRVPHREGYGIKASLSPDGEVLAYLSLPDY